MLTKKRNLASLVSDAKKRTQDFDRKVTRLYIEHVELQQEYMLIILSFHI